MIGCLESIVELKWFSQDFDYHYTDVIMGAIASQITSLTAVYSTVYSDADQGKHQSSTSLAFVWGIHRGPVNSTTNGQWRGKCFHLMTSSCPEHFLLTWLSYYIQYKVWEGGVTYQLPNLNDEVEDWEWINNSIKTVMGMWPLIHAVIEVNPC